MTARVPFDVAAYERAVSRLGGRFICGFLAGKRGMDHELLYDDGMWRPLDGSMDGRSDMLPPLDPPGCADRRTCKVNLDDLRWDRPDLDCEFEQARGIRRNLQLDETGGGPQAHFYRHGELISAHRFSDAAGVPVDAHRPGSKWAHNLAVAGDSPRSPTR